jgi:hypothetical protein
MEDFYRHSAMSDGHLGKCKDCTKLDMRIDRDTKPRVREYDRERAKLPHRIANAVRITRAWRLKHKDRVRAHNMAANAKLTAPALCEGCGLPKKLEKHHPDYSKPLLVVWFCKPCHAIADKIRRKLESA